MPEFSPKDIEAIARTDEAKMLLQMLRNDGGSGLTKATEAMNKGDYAEAVSLLKPLLNTPNSQALMQAINKKLGRNQ